MRRPLALFLTLALASCVSEVRDLRPGLHESGPTVSRPVEAWEVVPDGRVAGTVVVFQVQDGEERFFQVRNQHNQELGMVDAEGRWWRFALHGRQSEWLGSGTVREGVCRILGVATDAPFYDVPVATLSREALGAGAPASQN